MLIFSYLIISLTACFIVNWNNSLTGFKGNYLSRSLILLWILPGATILALLELILSLAYTVNKGEVVDEFFLFFKDAYYWFHNGDDL